VANAVDTIQGVMRLSLMALALGLGGCVSPTPAPSGGPVPVVTTTTVLADLVANVGGDLVSVTSLVPKGGDVHTFNARPADIRAVASARLLVMNGLGLDDWLERTVANAAAPDTTLVKLAENLAGVELLPGEDPGTQNPHLWLDVHLAALYVDRVAAALERIDSAHASAYAAQADAYKARLEILDTEIRTQVASIPQADRNVVMFHDAFPYFARAYGITIVGVAVQAPGQDPSAGYTADLIAVIRAAGVKAIFSEAQFPTRLVDQLAAETGATVVATLYDDALTEEAPSYEALMRWDATQFVMALR
jgi:ABC-type Zn uptake system ZnuABC Zn-binding protein ZnuA